MEVRGIIDADAITYLNRTAVHVIGNESLRTQLSELYRPLHSPKWPRAGACDTPRRIGTRRAEHKACSSPYMNVNQMTSRDRHIQSLPVVNVVFQIYRTTSSY